MFWKTEQIQKRKVIYLDGHVANAANDGGSDLGAERVPDTVLDLLFVLLDGHTLLAVDGFAHNHVSGNESIILAFRDEAPLKPNSKNESEKENQAKSLKLEKFDQKKITTFW